MLTFDIIDWDDETDPDGNSQHVARHGLTTDEVDDVLFSPAVGHGFSRTSNRPCGWGRTMTGKHILVIYETTEDPSGLTVIRPVTAYEVPV